MSKSLTLLSVYWLFPRSPVIISAMHFLFVVVIIIIIGYRSVYDSFISDYEFVPRISWAPHLQLIEFFAAAAESYAAMRDWYENIHWTNMWSWKTFIRKSGESEMDVIVDCAWFNNTKWKHARSQHGRLMTRDRKKKKSDVEQSQQIFCETLWNAGNFSVQWSYNSNKTWEICVIELEQSTYMCDECINEMKENLPWQGIKFSSAEAQRKITPKKNVREDECACAKRERRKPRKSVANEIG